MVGVKGIMRAERRRRADRGIFSSVQRDAEWVHDRVFQQVSGKIYTNLIARHLRRHAELHYFLSNKTYVLRITLRDVEWLNQAPELPGKWEDIK